VAFFMEVREHAPLPQTALLTVIAQDPSIRSDGRILTAQVPVPAEVTEPGPRGARFHVVDYDAANGVLEPPANVTVPDSFEDAAEQELRSAAFRAQNVYAIAARTLATFEGALGRRLNWAFRGHQLFLVPRAFPELNAYYSPEDGAILFGYLPVEGGELETCLSYDVIAHETTHAILDGLRPRYAEPGLSDQPAFHEALGDIVALLSVFSMEEVVERLLGEADDEGRIAIERVTMEALRDSALFTLADELGRTSGGDRGSGIRRSVALLDEPSGAWREERAFVEPHRRGEVVVAALMGALLRMWEKRIEALRTEKGCDRERVAEEGATAAEHLLRMVARGVDYMPPVELEFEDVLDSILKADEVMAPDDGKHDYRGALCEAFAAFDIHRPELEQRIVDLQHFPPPVYDRMNFEALRASPDEVTRFIWENAEVFSIDREYRLRVESVSPSVRTGPDGLIVGEVVASYVQSVELSAAELAESGVEVPAKVGPETRIEVWGGGVLIFDQFGRAKLHQTKPLRDWARQQRRLEYLVSEGLVDRQGRYGFTISAPRGQRFAALHISNRRAEEDW
jgi:hypothetical protein